MSQHMQALQRANMIRYARADWKRTVRAMTRHQGACEVARMIRTLEPVEAAGLTLGAALGAIPRVGDLLAAQLLADVLPFATGAPMRKVQDLTAGERERVAAHLERVVWSRHRRDG